MDSVAFCKYFPLQEGEMRSRFDAMGALYSEWNSKINLISRSDLSHLYERHILHSLSIAKFITFRPGTRILDVGTGGGFPGIPLAVFFPQCSFVLCDSIGKKIMVVKDVISRLGLQNAEAVNNRAENLGGSFDFVVSRATAPLADLHRWAANQVSRKQQNAIPNGIICLKGGDLKDEIAPFKNRTEVVALSTYFDEPFFETKKLVFLTC